VANVGYATLQIIPSARGFSAALTAETAGPLAAAGRASGERMGDGVNSGFASKVGAVAGIIGKAGLLVAGVAGAAGGAAAAIGVKTAASMEQAEIGFTTMLGSGEKAKAFLGELSAFAAKTPFEFPELQTAASSLISAGVEADQVIPIMTSLGNATSGMGTGSEGVKRATVALQQMNAAGKITGEDLNQLRDAGIPVYDLLAAATGKSKEEVSALAAKGKLGRVELEQLMTALGEGKGLERFGGLMDKQSQSLTGLASTAKDAFGVGMATAIAPLIPLIKDGLGVAIEFLGTAMPKLADGISYVLDLFKGGGEESGFLTGLQSISSAVEAMLPTLQAIGAGFIAGFRLTLDFITTYVVPAVVALATFLTEKWNEIVAFAQMIWPQLSEAIGHVVNVVTALWRMFGDNLLAIIIAAWELIKAVVSAAIDVVKGIIQVVVAVINGDWSAAWEGVKQIISAVWDAIKAIVTFAVAAVIQVLKAAWDAVRAVTGAAWSAVSSAVSTAGEAVKGFVVAMVARVLAVIIGLAQLPGKVAAYFLAMVAAAKAKAGELIAYAVTLPGRILSALGSLHSKLIGAGRDLIQGLIKGVQDRIAGAVKAVVDGVKRMLRAAKSALGISSPSRVFADIGRQTGDGLILGLRERAADADAAMRALVRPPVSAWTPTPSQRADLAHGGLAGAAGRTPATVTHNYRFGDIHGLRLEDVLREADRKRRAANLVGVGGA
jgi:tape measure domain-containing protein